MSRALGALCALLMTGIPQAGFSQSADDEHTLSFEVASVRENVSGPGGGWYEVRPGGLLIRNYELQLLIARAYGINLSVWPQYLVGGDGAILTKRFDIEASAGREADADEVSLMLRTLLEERFKLRLRKEVRGVPVYEVIRLREDRLGPNLRPSPHDCRAMNQALRAKGKSIEALAELRSPHGGLACRDGGSRPPPSAFRYKSSGTLEALFQYAQGFAGRQIVDATGLSGTFEWNLEFIPGSRSTLELPSIFVAFEEQLGLRLRPATADTEVLVIVAVELPDPN